MHMFDDDTVKKTSNDLIGELEEVRGDVKKLEHKAEKIEEEILDAEEAVWRQASQQESEVDKMMLEQRLQMRSSLFSYVSEFIKIALLALAIILPVRYFLIKPFYVNGASMEPSYYDHEYLIVDEISYRLNGPERGDVVVFHYPQNHSEYFIKRIIGLPEERVVIAGGGVTIYNSAHPEGVALKEPYLQAGTQTAMDTDIMLKAGEYFVLGDNRSRSLDSRRFGPVRRDEVVGRAWLRGWPPDRAGTLERHEFDF